MAVWREKLIGYYVGKLSENEISGTIEDVNRFAASPLARAEMPRGGFLCEWYFYDALLQSLIGDPITRRSRMLERLKKVLDTNERGFLEYNFAQDFIKRIGRGEDLTSPTKLY